MASSFLALRRGRCLAEIERMISLPLPAFLGGGVSGVSSVLGGGGGELMSIKVTDNG